MPGSVQLRSYVALRRAGMSRADACFESGLPEAEAELVDADEARGELAWLQPTPINSEGSTTMARKKKDEPQNGGAVAKPDFKRALSLMVTDLKPAAEESAKIRGDQSAAWKTIEKDCHLNKKGAKFFFALRGMSQELRDDVLRTLYGLMREGNVGISEDLVSLMDENGEDRDMPIQKRAPEPLVTLN